VSGRLDDEKLETLRRWGAGLGADGRDELRAAGKAILILIEEIERLQVDVWHTHDGSREQVTARRERGATPAAVAVAPPDIRALERVGDDYDFLSGGASADDLEPTLRERLRKLMPNRAVKIE
jgi:hypothetical protein